MIEEDGARQRFVRVENVRITVSHRSGEQDWAQTGRYLSFRAYQNGESGKLFPGPDIPIRSADRSDEDILDAARALLKVIIS